MTKERGLEPSGVPGAPPGQRGDYLLARCRPGLTSSSRPPAVMAVASGQTASAPLAPSDSESWRWAPAGRVASRCWNVASPDCSPPSGPRRPRRTRRRPARPWPVARVCAPRTGSRAAPEITPPARHTRQNAASAAMKTFVSVRTRSAAPGAAITSSARGATAAQRSPASTPSTMVERRPPAPDDRGARPVAQPPGAHGLVAVGRVGEGKWHTHGRQQRTRRASRPARQPFRCRKENLATVVRAIVTARPIQGARPGGGCREIM